MRQQPHAGSAKTRHEPAYTASQVAFLPSGERLMPLQTWIHHWEEGAGSRLIKVVIALLGFVALASLYDLLSYENYASEEAMENAQLARNVSQGKGYTTDSIRPLALYLLESAAAT